MAKVSLSACVTEADDGTWDANCPVTDGSCGTRPEKVEDRVPWRSTGWPTKATARARLDEHVEEHKTGQPASDLNEFRAKHGLIVDESGVVRAEDLP